MQRRNIVLLGTDSQDSSVKADAYAAGARALGLDVRAAPNAATAGIFPASDYRALCAAWMCKTHGVPGPDPVAMSIAMSKSLSYQLLQSNGFELLRWIVPVRYADLNASMRGPVIVKPDHGSGSTSSTPWGYRVFDSLRDFKRFLDSENLVDRFLTAQVFRPHERQLVMEYVEGSEVHSIATVVGAGEPVLYDTNVMRPMSESNKVVGRILLGVRHPDTPNALRMAGALAAAGLRRSIIYLQCVARGGRLYLIDINLRPGAMWGQAAVALKVKAYEELIAVMLGMKPQPDIRWPSPYIGIARAPLPLRPGRFRVEVHDPQAVLLSSETRYDPAKPYDSGHAWPMFAVKCERAEDFERRADEVTAAVRRVEVKAKVRERQLAAGAVH